MTVASSGLVADTFLVRYVDPTCGDGVPKSIPPSAVIGRYPTPGPLGLVILMFRNYLRTRRLNRWVMDAILKPTFMIANKLQSCAI